MELTLRRVAYKPAYTIGRLYKGHTLICETLEPSRRKNNPHPCIPEGRYLVMITKSPKFGRWLPVLLNVPGRVGIRIHPGNFPSDTQGCILPGWNHYPGRVTESAACMRTIMELCDNAQRKNEQIWIKIVH